MALDRVTKTTEAIKPQTNTDPWKSDQTTWEFVSIPDEDALGYAHPPIGLNAHSFEAGKTYKVPPQVAAFVRERLKAYQRATVRVMSPKRDFAAEQAVAVGSANARNTTPVGSDLGAASGETVFTVA